MKMLLYVIVFSFSYGRKYYASQLFDGQNYTKCPAQTISRNTYMRGIKTGFNYCLI